MDQVARKLREEKAFFYPHNLDFRGRAYPLHPHLNHLGSDLCRGVLEFAVGRPLGATGFRWLKVHLANVFAGGVDKLSFDGRVAFVDSKLEEILDSAENPLDGRRWWLQAEDPFQCLAACMNIREALLSGNVETYASYLPVHQVHECLIFLPILRRMTFGFLKLNRFLVHLFSSFLLLKLLKSHEYCARLLFLSQCTVVWFE